MNRLRELRNRKGVRQQDIADYLSVAKSTYSYWERGTIEINNENLFRLSDYYGVSVDYLLGRAEDPTIQKDVADEDIKFALFNGDKDISDEALNEVKWFAKVVKERFDKGIK